MVEMNGAENGAPMEGVVVRSGGASEENGAEDYAVKVRRRSTNDGPELELTPPRSSLFGLADQLARVQVPGTGRAHHIRLQSEPASRQPLHLGGGERCGQDDLAPAHRWSVHGRQGHDQNSWQARLPRHGEVGESSVADSIWRGRRD